MIIVPQIVTTDQIVLELIFTTEETEHPLIETVKTDLNQEKSLSMETVDTGEKQIITRPINKDEDHMTILGELVDTIREKYCGDVTQPPIQSIAPKTKEPTYTEKDYTDNPQFKIGTTDNTEIKEEPTTKTKY